MNVNALRGSWHLSSVEPTCKCSFTDEDDLRCLSKCHDAQARLSGVVGNNSTCREGEELRSRRQPIRCEKRIVEFHRCCKGNVLASLDRLRVSCHGIKIMGMSKISIALSSCLLPVICKSKCLPSLEKNRKCLPSDNSKSKSPPSIP